jgi:hypothetical protein
MEKQNMVPWEELADRARLADIVHDFAAALDGREWSRLIALFTTGDVTFDYSSYSGNPPVVTTAQAWFGRLASAHPGFDVTQHSVSNLRFQIGQGQAHVTAYLRAEHFLTSAGVDSQATLGGSYSFNFVNENGGWQITAMRLGVTWKTGNNALYALSFAGTPAGEVQ